MPRRWFISYRSPEGALAEQLKNAIARKDPDSHIFFAPSNLRVGGFWSAQLAQEIADATAFVLLVGSQGIGNWQVLEYNEALDKKLRFPNFPLTLVLLEGQSVPGLPFLRQLHWIVTPDPASENVVGRLLDAGENSRPGELWRYTSPYRGLAAMEQKDSDYFFGRAQETVEVVRTIAENPDKISILLGNSGVGKSSLAQAGVLAALVRQGYPEEIAGTNKWPDVFKDSRRWCFLKFRPGTEPVTALVEAFLETWQLDRTSTEWPVRRAEWVSNLISGVLKLRDLLDQTTRRYTELQYQQPESFLIYVDQGEELYVRADATQRRPFSEILKQGISDKRIRVLISMRSDFLGELQKDEPLYSVHQQINVPPMRENALLELVSRPAQLLSARFETPALAADIARRAADESTQDAGALPLLSYLLDDMWRRMVERGDGLLRLPAQSIDLGRVLVDRANTFLENHPNSEEKLRRIFTLKLATVRDDGEPTRRRAWRSEFSDDEWRLVSELADHPNRLLTTVTPKASGPPGLPAIVGAKPPDDESYAEVAHETIFRRWDKLRVWITAEREFLAWRSGLEADRRAWQAAPDNSRNDALLMGLPLKQAVTWCSRRPDDIPAIDRGFIERSRRVTRLQRLRVQAVIAVLVLALTAGLSAWWQGPWLKEQTYRLAYVRTVSGMQALALPKGRTFRDCTDCPEMIVIPSGNFWMGSPVGQGPKDREQPQHQVTIAQSFAVSINEVSFAEWDKCASVGDCKNDVNAGSWGRGKQPVINVTWHDAERYTKWLSRMTGETYRLLTEAEWEYAARAKPGSKANEQTLYSFGNDDEGLLRKYAWYADGDTNGPSEVGQKKPNPFGLYDMHGNVWEWVEDCFREGYAPSQTDSAAWKAGNCAVRTMRGGSFRFRPSILRSASRDQAGIDSKDNDRGLRIARELRP